MTVNRTTLLDLPLPVTGTESGTWGDTTNNGLTQYLDIAIAGSLVLSADSDTTLSSTEGDSSATNIGGTTAQYAVLRCTGARTTTRNINAPAWAISGGTISNYSKTYIVINDTTGGQSIVLRATNSATPTYTTGVTIVAGERAVCAWNGSDFVKVGGAAGGTNTQVQYNNNGVFGGVSGATTNGTAITFSTTNLKLQGSSTGVSSFASANSSATDYTVTFPAASTTIPVATQTLTFSGPTTARTITLPDANFTAARTDSAQTFTGVQTFSSNPVLSGGTANGVLYLNGSNVATSGSALTFDGTKLGVGATATAPLTVQNALGFGIDIVGQASDASQLRLRNQANNANLAYVYVDSSALEIGSGAAIPVKFTVNGTERMRLDSSGNLGIGTSSPASYSGYTTLDIDNATNGGLLNIKKAGTTVGYLNGVSGITLLASGTNNLQLTTAGAGNIIFNPNATTRMVLNSSGNLGLGVTPQSWNTDTRMIDVGNSVSVGNTYGGPASLVFNGVQSTASSGAWSYRINASVPAGLYTVDSAHKWYIAPSGTAGTAITFTQAMTLDASGNLGLGTTSPSYRLDVDKGSSGIVAKFKGGTKPAYIYSDNDLVFFCSDIYVATGFGCHETSDYLTFFTGNTERARITSDGMFQVNSAVSSATALSTTNPFRIYTGTSTFTDTGAAGTRTHGTIVAFDNPAIAATNATVTYTNASTVYIDGAPTAGTNAAITNAYALYVNAGNVSAAGVYSATVGGTNRDVYVDNTGLIGYVSSTRASKTNITNITDANWLLQLNPVSFNYRKKDEAGNYTEEADGPIEFGLIAEDTEAIKPELCFYDDVDGKQELRGISYSKLITPMLKLLQEQQALIISLTARVAALEGTQP